MKTLNQLSNECRLMPLVLFTLLISLIGCTKEDTDSTGPDDQLEMKTRVVQEGAVTLQGVQRWYVYAKKEHRLIVDPAMMYTTCNAEMIFTGGQNFELKTTETIGDMLFREITFKGKMTPGGALKFSWPDTWLELNLVTFEYGPTAYPNVVAQIGDHTGYVLSGPGANKGTVNYTGFFDGSKFFADCHVNAFQLEPGSMGEPYDIVVDGPIIFSMLLELQIVN